MDTTPTQAQIIEWTARVAACPSYWGTVTYDMWERYRMIVDATEQGFEPVERALLILGEFVGLKSDELSWCPADTVSEAITRLAFLKTEIHQPELREFWYDGQRYTATRSEAIGEYFRMRERLTAEPFGKYHQVQLLGILTEQAAKEIQAGDWEGLTMLLAVMTHDSQEEELEWGHERVIQAMKERAARFRHLPLPILLGATAFFLRSCLPYPRLTPFFMAVQALREHRSGASSLSDSAPAI